MICFMSFNDKTQELIVERTVVFSEQVYVVKSLLGNNNVVATLVNAAGKEFFVSKYDNSDFLGILLTGTFPVVQPVWGVKGKVVEMLIMGSLVEEVTGVPFVI